MKYVKYIPNTLSIFRLIASFSLLLITQIKDPLTMRITFTTAYLLIGGTDAIDGIIARKFHCESLFGAKIDNIADTSVFVTSFISMVWLLRLKFTPSFLICVIPLFIGVALKIFIFTLTRVRFGEWNSMHTYTNKAFGVVIFLSVPACLWIGSLDVKLAIGLMVFAAITAAEDTYILLKSKTYNVNHKGLLFERRDAKHSAE